MEIAAIVLLGIVVSVTGLGRVLAGSAVFAVYHSVVDMVTGPLTALVLITVGYDFKT